MYVCSYCKHKATYLFLFMISFIPQILLAAPSSIEEFSRKPSTICATLLMPHKHSLIFEKACASNLFLTDAIEYHKSENNSSYATYLINGFQ